MSATDPSAVRTLALRRRPPTFVLLDADLRVRSIACEETTKERGVQLQLGGPLPAPAAAVVARAIEAWRHSIVPPEHLEFIGGLLLRVVAVAAVDGLSVGVYLEPFKPQRSAAWAREFFGLSAREAQVLDLLLAGSSTADIAESLTIAHSTAADHVKRLLQKTASNSRLELFTKILG